MTKINIKEIYLDELKSIIKKYIPDTKVLVYGSRLTENYHSGSDLDLAIVGNCDLGIFKQALNDSNIPFLIDVVKYDDVSESFKEEILKNYIELN